MSSVQAQTEVVCLTKTTNGNTAIDTDLRSTFTGMWLLMQDSDSERIVKLYSDAITKTLLIEDEETRITRMVHILILVLRFRDFRNGGQGRRKESIISLLSVCTLLNEYKITEIMLYIMASHYGRWNDLSDVRDVLDTDFKELKKTYKNITPEFVESSKRLITQLFVLQIVSEKKGAELTMCAKYFPTEGKNVERAIECAKLLFPTITQDKTFNGKQVGEKTTLKNKWHRLLKSLRIYLQPLRNQIPMIERYLCSKNAHLIEPSKVPGVALQRSKRALENVVSLKSLGKKKDRTNDDQRSKEPNRIKCAENFANHAKAALEASKKHNEDMDKLNEKLDNCTDEAEKLAIENEIEKAKEEFEKNAPKVHGGDTVFIHDLVGQYKREGKPNDLIEAQFAAMQSKLGALSKMRILYVLDTSGSMDGIPIQVGTGLVALSASSSSPAFRHKFISFSRIPKVMDCSNLNGGNPRLWDYMQYINQNSIVENTNVQATIDLIAGICSGRNMSSTDITRGTRDILGRPVYRPLDLHPPPVQRTTSTTYSSVVSNPVPVPVESPLDMIIFLSDTQFDRIADTTRGCLPGDYLKKKFEEIGQKAPLCCFWNLNGKVINSPAEPSDKGIVMMSGYSHTMLNSLVETITAASQASFDEEERRKEAEEAEETKQLNTFQLMLDFCEGDFGMNLREKLSELKTGIFTEYKYEKVLDEITV
jgi:hypothetical protein